MFGHSDYKRIAENAKRAEAKADAEKEKQAGAVDKTVEQNASEHSESQIMMGHRHGNYWN